MSQIRDRNEPSATQKVVKSKAEKNAKPEEPKVLKNSLSTVISQAQRLYGDGSKFAKITEKEMSSVHFTNEFPLIYLDLVDHLTGEQILKQLHAFEFPQTYQLLINSESPAMMRLKSQICDKFYPFVFQLFDTLGHIAPSEMSSYKLNYKESIQFITFESLQAKMNLVFGVRNKMFAKMLFLFLSGRRPLNA